MLASIKICLGHSSRKSLKIEKKVLQTKKHDKHVLCLSDFVIIGFRDLLLFVNVLPIANSTLTTIFSVTAVTFCD